MPTYSLRVKKGKYQLDLTTTDNEFIVGQFELWVRDAGDYAKKMKVSGAKDMVDSQIKAEEEITRKNIESQISKTSRKNRDSEIIPDEAPEKSQDTGKNETNTPSSDLDIFYAPPGDSVEDNVSTEKPATAVFDDILANNMNNPQTELSFKPSPSIKKDNAFLNFINSRNIDKKIDFLLLTAYYFAQYEQKPRFTLKQLNSKLMQNVAVIIDHGVLQEAINRDYIECLPDLTGLIGASEYRLTAYGEKTIMDE